MITDTALHASITLTVHFCKFFAICFISTHQVSFGKVVGCTSYWLTFVIMAPDQTPQHGAQLYEILWPLKFTFSMLWWRARSSSRMCRRISETSEKKPWNRCDWCSSSSNLGPDRLANISANLWSRVSRRTRRRMACRVSASTGKPRSTTEHLPQHTRKTCKTWKKNRNEGQPSNSLQPAFEILI